ncbi:F-box domain-containing protein [Mycena sanguinolenta]|uniref:F-box domain-containing protein n=1 Tax=Mycena sanguinolenta TaxID=230812 RepID=A0A8H6YRW3_9AGAR|nr:F-box domain-containing protein [Mycena sanguinolenta]
MSSLNSRLPNELTEHVIQDLHSDLKTLANCALVCRTWAPPAQRIVLSKLSINEKNCTDIIEHLTSATPNIASYVKRLYVFLWGDIRTNLNRKTANLTPLLHLLLPHISHFTHVTELVFDGCRAFHNLNWDDAWTDLLAGAFPSLSRLTVHYLTFETLEDLVDLVSSFSQLTHLTAVDIDIAEASHEHMNEDQEPYKGSKQPPPQLETIKYSSGPQAFTTLHLDLAAEAGDVNAGVDLIKAAASHLKTLSLDFDDQWQMWEDLELASNSSLTSLGFKRVSDLGAGLMDLLRTVASPLERLTLGCVEEMLLEETLSDLIEVLMSPNFASLVRVNFFDNCNEQSSEEFKENVAKEYPDFFARGISVFECKRLHHWDEKYIV